MKAKITKEGYLQLERKGKFKDQYCPYQQIEIGCGDWCPLFQCMKYGKAAIKLTDFKGQVKLCQACNILLEDIIDER